MKKTCEEAKTVFPTLPLTRSLLGDSGKGKIKAEVLLIGRMRTTVTRHRPPFLITEAI